MGTQERSSSSRGQDTICALATSPVRGGVGIIRISGPATPSVLVTLTGRTTDRFEPLKLTYCRFHDPEGQVIDEGYSVWMPGPRSYTAEDSAELHAHGGAANLTRLLRATVAAGARAADRGEFTLRAFLNGRIDLCQAEAVMDVVQAPTETALQLAHAQLAGSVSRAAGELRRDTIAALARLEVQIDFADEELNDVHGTRPTTELRDLRDRVDVLSATFQRGQVLRNGARVLLLGPPNAGKSSLFNALLRRSRAIVTEVPGTTRDFLEETMDAGGVPVTLIDTAGVREDVADLVESAGVERSLALIAEADLVLLVADCTQPPWSATAVPAHKAMRVRTKADLGDGDVSAETGWGLDALRDRIADRLLPAAAGGDGLTVITLARHHAALVAAADALAQAIDACEVGHPPEIVAVDVQEALAHLGLIVGETSTDDLLDSIFSEFCLGK